MRCDRCGETMRPETVIKLHRSFGLVRATQAQGAYCTICGTSTPAGHAPALAPGGAWKSWARLTMRAGGRTAEAAPARA